jgi:hypothetical protein
MEYGGSTAAPWRKAWGNLLIKFELKDRRITSLKMKRRPTVVGHQSDA